MNIIDKASARKAVDNKSKNILNECRVSLKLAKEALMAESRVLEDPESKIQDEN